MICSLIINIGKHRALGLLNYTAIYSLYDKLKVYMIVVKLNFAFCALLVNKKGVLIMNKKRVISLLLSSVMIASLAACGTPAETSQPSASSGNTTSSTSADNTAEPQEPVKLEWLAYQTNAQPDPDAEIIKMVEEKFNVEFEFWHVDDQNWDDSLNVKLAGGSMPDVLRLKNPNSLGNYVEQGIVSELPKSVIEEKAPQYYKMIADLDVDNNAWDKVTYEGKNYGFVGMTKDGEYAPVVGYRQDWMENVGIEKVPTTLDEFEELVYAFSHDDPDGNGQKDTYGISDRGIRAVFGAFGVPVAMENTNMQVVINDEGLPVYAQVQPEAKEALALLQKWYADGVIDPEYITGENTGGYWADSHAFINGRVGTTTGFFYHLSPPFYEGESGGTNYKQLVAINPDAEVVSALPPVGANGDSGMATTGSFREPIVLTSQCMEDERKVDTVMDMLETLYTDMEYATLVRYGIEGVNYEINDMGEMKSISIEGVGNVKELGLMMFNFLCVPPELQASLQPAKYQYADEVAAGPFYTEIFVPSTDVISKNNNDLVSLVEESYAKIITGEESIDYFDTFVEEWNDIGGAESTASMQESYASLNK